MKEWKDEWTAKSATDGSSDGRTNQNYHKDKRIYFKRELGTYIISAHPESTPRTRFNIKNEPRIISGMKYIQLYQLPKASFV